jgi:hypothetical protein
MRADGIERVSGGAPLTRIGQRSLFFRHDEAAPQGVPPQIFQSVELRQVQRCIKRIPLHLKKASRDA